MVPLRVICTLLLIFKVCSSYYTYPDERNSYTSMSDIDWSKRNYYGWINPAYGYSGSMADGDWGWKKRSSSEKYSNYYPLKNSRRGSYYGEPKSYASRYYGYRPSTTNQDRSYGFHSMADVDWGWKKRKRYLGSALSGNKQLYSYKPKGSLSFVRSYSDPDKRYSAFKPLLSADVSYPPVSDKQEIDDENKVKQDVYEGNDLSEDELLNYLLPWYFSEQENKFNEGQDEYQDKKRNKILHNKNK